MLTLLPRVYCGSFRLLQRICSKHANTKPLPTSSKIKSTIDLSMLKSRPLNDTLSALGKIDLNSKDGKADLNTQLNRIVTEIPNFVVTGTSVGMQIRYIC